MSEDFKPEIREMDADGRRMVASIKKNYFRGFGHLVLAVDETLDYCNSKYSHAYLASALECDRSHISRLRQFGLVRRQLTDSGVSDPPDHEGTVRPMLPHRNDAGVLFDIWELAGNKADADKKTDRITNKHVKAAVDEIIVKATTEKGADVVAETIKDIDRCLARLRKAGSIRKFSAAVGHLTDARINLQELVA